MKASPEKPEPRFVVATPGRSVCDDNARALENHGLLRFIALGTRRGIAGVSPEHTRLNPGIGLAAFAANKVLSRSLAESFRFRLHPWFDHWVRNQLNPGDHVLSSYGYVNGSFRWAQQNGGKTFLDAGNSHPENFWALIVEEHRRWHYPHPPFARHHYERTLAMMAHVDYVLSPSSYVTRSFLSRGFKPEQILHNIYPLDLQCFSPAAAPRPDRPFTLVSTGSLSLRKGTPYLLEAFEIVRKKIPNTRFLLTSSIEASVQPELTRHASLPIEWSPALPHPQLAERLRSADLFLLPSLEDGFARTVAEALACGLPVVTTPNTGASDLIQPGINGEIVPIRNPPAIAEAVFKWAEKILSPGWQPHRLVDAARLDANCFERDFLRQLAEKKLVPPGREKTP